MVDRESGRVALIASAEGGVEIEAVAAENPEAIVTVPVDPASGFQPHHGRSLAFGLGLAGEPAKAAGKLGRAVYDAVLGTDASLVEINPLIETTDGALDRPRCQDEHRRQRALPATARLPRCAMRTRKTRPSAPPASMG